MIRHLALLLLLVGVAHLQADEIELLPPPRVAEPPLKFEKITGGFQVSMSRTNAERLLDTMKMVKNEEALGDLIKSVGANSTDEYTQALTIYWTHVVTKEMPAFKKALEQKMGPNGVVVKMYGFDRTKERPVLKAIGKAFLPKEVQEQAQGIMAMVNTKALFWRIESRE
jgi:hypothetical protein